MIQTRIYNQIYLHRVEFAKNFLLISEKGSVDIAFHFYFHCILIHDADTNAQSLWLDLRWPSISTNCTYLASVSGHGLRIMRLQERRQSQRSWITSSSSNNSILSTTSLMISANVNLLPIELWISIQPVFVIGSSSVKNTLAIFHAIEWITIYVNCRS